MSKRCLTLTGCRPVIDNRDDVIRVVETHTRLEFSIASPTTKLTSRRNSFPSVTMDKIPICNHGPPVKVVLLTMLTTAAAPNRSRLLAVRWGFNIGTRQDLFGNQPLHHFVCSNFGFGCRKNLRHSAHPASSGHFVMTV